VPTYQTRLFKELSEGHNGRTIPESTRVYFQERFKNRLFDFLITTFLREEQNGLTQAKLARRSGKSPEVINRWLSAPSNLTAESISDLLLGMAAEEPEFFKGSSLLNRSAKNYTHLDEEETARGTSPPAPINVEFERL